jgi:hypothetical protein
MEHSGTDKNPSRFEAVDGIEAEYGDSLRTVSNRDLLRHFIARSNEELVGILERPNGWHRDTATRLLCERHDDGIVPSLVTVLNSDDPRKRAFTHSGALDGL